MNILLTKYQQFCKDEVRSAVNEHESGGLTNQKEFLGLPINPVGLILKSF